MTRPKFTQFPATPPEEVARIMDELADFARKHATRTTQPHGTDRAPDTDWSES